MVIKIKGKDQELKYTFNSFKYMQEFSPSEFEKIEKSPFKIIPLIEMLMMGALNSNPRIKFKEEDVQDFLEAYAVDNNVSTLLTDLMSLLEDSSFFKSLQKTE